MTLQETFGKPPLFHRVGWHGKDGITSSIPGYDSRDISVINRQLKIIRTVGGPGAGVIALSFGLTSSFITESCLNVCNQCAALGMPFALCFDPWTVSGASNIADINNVMITTLKSPDYQFMLNSPTYLKGKPVLEFSIGADPTAILAAVPDIQYWREQVDYDWVQIPEQPNKTALPCAYMQFDDGTGKDRNKMVWDQTKLARIVPPKAGRTFYGRNVKGARDYVQVISLDDYTEGTAFEVSASVFSGIAI